MKKLFVLSPFHYNYFIKNVNAVWLGKNLFKNGDLYFYFLSYNNFKITFKQYVFEQFPLINTPLEYNIDKNGNNNGLDFIKNHINEMKVFFCFPSEVFSYKFQMYAFIRYFNINEYKLKENNDLNYLDKYSFIENSYINIKTDNNQLNKIFIKKMFLILLSNKIFSFFYSKTTIKENIDLLFLLLDQNIKLHINKESKNVLSVLKDNSVDEYNFLFKMVGKNLDFLYMYIDFEDDAFNINNKETYRKLPSEVFINDILYLSEVSYKKQSLYKLKFTFNEALIGLNDFYSIEEIYYKMLQIYEFININKKNEIINYYSPINIKIDILNIIKEMLKLLEIEDYYTIYNNFNKLEKKLKSCFIEEAKPLFDCPFCINGKIYNGKNKFFCNNCIFFLIKSSIKERYKFDLTKRYLKILLKNKYIIINQNGENRILYLKQTDKGFYLILLRKK